MAGKKSERARSQRAGGKQAREKKPLSEAQQAHLETLKPTQFQPGQSGNPAGRPKSIIADAYRRALQKQIANDKQGRTMADAVAAKVVAMAVKGDIKAIEELTDRVDGKAVQAVELGGRGGGPLRFADISPAENFAAIMAIAAKGKGKNGDAESS